MNYPLFGMRTRDLDGGFTEISLYTINMARHITRHPCLPVCQRLLVPQNTDFAVCGVTTHFVWKDYANDMEDLMMVLLMQLESLLYIREMIPNGGVGIFERGIELRNSGLHEGFTHNDVENVVLSTLGLYPTLQPLFETETWFSREHDDDLCYSLLFKEDLPGHIKLNIWEDLRTAWDACSLFSREELDNLDQEG